MDFGLDIGFSFSTLYCQSLEATQDGIYDFCVHIKTKTVASIQNFVVRKTQNCYGKVGGLFRQTQNLIKLSK